MLLKAGVDISRLERFTRRGLGIAEAFYNSQAEEMVITSTYEGNHGAGSLHYANRAFDIRLPYMSGFRAAAILREKLGPDFDVIGEDDHIHIEYDPK